MATASATPLTHESSNPPARAPRRKALPALTGVRFLAAMQVVFFHFGASFALRHHFPRPVCLFLGNGWTSVTLFFLLSGFILSYTYSGQIRGRRNRNRFWEARFARIYPVYLLSLLAMIPFAFSAARPNAVHSVWQGLSVLTMVQAWNPFHPQMIEMWNFPAWTLSVEAFFYLLFPFVFPLMEKLSDRLLRLSAVLLLLLVVFTHTMTAQSPAAPLWCQILHLPLPLIRTPEFLLGAISGVLFLRRGPIRYAGGLAAISVVAIVFLESTISGPWISLVAVPFGLLLFALASGDGLVSSLFSTRSFVLLGGASYSVYLLQVPVRLWVDRALGAHGSPLIDAAISPLILVAIAVVVFLYWEEPARKWIRSLVGAQRSVSSASVAPASSNETA